MFAADCRGMLGMLENLENIELRPYAHGWSLGIGWTQKEVTGKSLRGLQSIPYTCDKTQWVSRVVSTCLADAKAVSLVVGHCPPMFAYRWVTELSQGHCLIMGAKLSEK